MYACVHGCFVCMAVHLCEFLRHVPLWVAQVTAHHTRVLAPLPHAAAELRSLPHRAKPGHGSQPTGSSVSKNPAVLTEVCGRNNLLAGQGQMSLESFLERKGLEKPRRPAPQAWAPPPPGPCA